VVPSAATAAASVLRRGDARLVEENVCALELARPEDERLVELEGGTQLLEREKVRVHATAADDVTARRGQDDFTTACEQRPSEEDRRADLLAQVRVELRDAECLGVDGQRISAGPLGTGSDGLEQQDQRLDVLDTRNVGEVDRLVAEERGRDDRQRRVLVARGADASGETGPALDEILHCWHWRRAMGRARVRRAAWYGVERRTEETSLGCSRGSSGVARCPSAPFAPRASSLSVGAGGLTVPTRSGYDGLQGFTGGPALAHRESRRSRAAHSSSGCR